MNTATVKEQTDGEESRLRGDRSAECMQAEFRDAADQIQTPETEAVQAFDDMLLDVLAALTLMMWRRVR